MSPHPGVCVAPHRRPFVAPSNAMYLHAYNTPMNECMSAAGWKEHGTAVDGTQSSPVQSIPKYNEMLTSTWVFLFLFVDEEKI